MYGFVNNMEQLMIAADVVITKAGPGTIMEAAALCRPLLLTGAVGLQEEGNINFVLDAGIGNHCPSHSAVCQMVSRLTDEIPRPCPSQELSFAGTPVIAEILLSSSPSKGEKN